MGEGTGLQLSLDFAALGPSTGDGAVTTRTDGESATSEGDDAVATGGAEADAADGGGAADATDLRELLESPASSDGPTAVEVAPAEPGSRVAAALRDPSLVERFELGQDVSGWLAAQRELAVGLALDDPRPRRGTVLGLAVAGHDGRVIAAESGASDALLDQVLASGMPVAGHDIKQLFVSELARRDPDATASPADPRVTAPLPRVSFDTQIAAYILNAALRSQSLADISAERLGVELPKAGELRGPEHAAIEALAVAAARETLAPKLDEEGLRRLYEEIELPLIPVLASLEATGVVIDRAKLGELDAVFSQEIGRLEEGIFESVGHRFTIGSPKQLEQVLFYELDLPRGKRTKTGYSTDASVLEDLRGAHPAIDKILDWRLYTKLKSTYVDALPLLIDAHTGRLHTTFHQAVASTGRLSSTDPNLQNIPIRTELGRRIRGAFVAGREDLVLLAADYSQIELRILAHVSGDVHLREAFERKADIHRETAARVLHKDAADVTHGERSMAKMVNFGIAYGMSDYGLSTRAGIPRGEAQEFINRYFATYSGISYYMLHIKDVARRQGYVTTLLGRRRWIPELEARNQTLRSAGERMAINMPIQGTAADIMKIALIRVADRLRRERSETRMLLTVHDELLMEVPRSELTRIAPVVRETMEGAMPLDVPLVVDLKSGADWDSLTPLHPA